jgi:uncharacterized repeat protein (TIGR01451 family)
LAPGEAVAQLRVGDRAAIATGATFGTAPAVAVNPSTGDAMVAWTDVAKESGDVTLNRVLGRRIDAQGNPKGNAFVISRQVFANPAQGGANPKLVYNSKTNQFLAVYERAYADAEVPGIFAQRLSINGAAAGGEIAVVQAAGRSNPAVAFDASNNRYLIAWSDGQGGIDARLASGAGEANGAVLSLIPGALRANNPSLAFNPSTKLYLLAFDLFSKTVSDVYGQLLNADGGLSGQPFALTDAANRQAEPEAVYNPAENRYAVFWSDSRNIAASGLNAYGQLVEKDGKLAGGNVSLANYALSPRAVYSLDQKIYLLSWIVQNSNDPYDAYLLGRYLNPDLSGLGSKFRISVGDKVQAPTALGVNASISRGLAVWPYSPDPTQADAVRNLHGQWLDLSVRLTDLSLSVKPKPNPVKVGETLRYKIVVANAGPAVAQQVQLTDDLPAGANFENADASQGVCALATAGNVACALDNIPSGKSVTIDLSVEPGELGNLVNQARLSWFNSESEASALTARTEVKSIYPGELQVLAPNGGEVLPAGGASAIRWTVTEPLEGLNLGFKLEYSLDRGASWKAVSSALASGDRFDWTVPVPAGNVRQGLVRVSGYANETELALQDRSDRTFAIEVVKLTAPNGGETLSSGHALAIAWTANATARPVARTALEYSADGGASWKRIALLGGNPGAYEWTAPAVRKPAARAKIRVRLLDEAGRSLGSDTGDGFFTLTP